MQTDAFLPSTLKDWLAVLVVLATFTTALWRISVKLTLKINGLGGRVKKVEESCNTITAHHELFSDELRESRAERTRMTERMGAVEQGQKDQHEVLQTIKLDIISHINEVRRIIEDGNSKTRERLVRLETMMEIERKIGRPLTEIEKQ